MQEEDKCKLWDLLRNQNTISHKKAAHWRHGFRNQWGGGETTTRKPSIYIKTLSVYIWTGAFGRIYLSFGLGLTMPSNGRMVYF